jgi:hypothetical protein
MRLKHLLTITLLPLFSSIALAGVAWTPADPFGTVEVIFNPDGSGSGSGVMSMARFSDNDVEVLGCGARFDDDGFIWGFCQAIDTDGVQIVCTTFNPHLVDAIRGINSFSFIRFLVDENAECTLIRFSTQSFQITEFKKTK